MEGGTAPWQKAWSGSQYTLRNGVTGHEYSGLNVLRLCLNTYEDPRYCTFNQAKDKGWKIKKGSHGHLILRICFIEKTEARSYEINHMLEMYQEKLIETRFILKMLEKLKKVNRYELIDNSEIS